ncbi:hypothetical protein ER57_12195 [Smithella sp. SCADC]|nr:hypothetical protein ER57_12195 [Smithella sp. SCADC]
MLKFFYYQTTNILMTKLTIVFLLASYMPVKFILVNILFLIDKLITDKNIICLLTRFFRH